MDESCDRGEAREVLAGLRHDLRGSARAVISFAELLLEAPEARESRFGDYLRRIHQAGVRIESLLAGGEVPHREAPSGGEDGAEVVRLAREVRASAEGFSLLYVEDDERERERNDHLFREVFERVDTVGDAEEGLRRFAAGRHDLVVSDLRLPGMGGLEMVARIKAQRHETSVIVTTAFEESDYLLRALDIGVRQYLLKPLNHVLVLSALDKVIRERLLERRVARLSQKIQNILNSQQSLLLVLAEGVASAANRRFLDYVGCHSVHEFNQRIPDPAALFKTGAGLFSPREDVPIETQIKGDGETLKAALHHAPGQPEAVFALQVAPLSGAEREHILSFTDISALEAQQHALKEESSIDPLTRVANRLSFSAQLDGYLERARAGAVPLALILLRLEGIGDCNLKLGNQAGDMILLAFARKLRELLPEGAYVARLGGVQFAALMPSQGGDAALKSGQALHAALNRQSYPFDARLRCSAALTELRAEDDADRFRRRARSLLVEAHRSLEGSFTNDLAAGEGGAGREEHDAICAILEEVRRRDGVVRFYNNYRGLALSSDGRVEVVEPELGMQIVVQNQQAYVMEREHTVMFTAPQLPQRVMAQVTGVKRGGGRARVHLMRMRYIASSPMDRRYVRVEPATPLRILLCGRLFSAEGELADISLESAMAHIPQRNPLHVGMEVTVHLELATTNHLENVEGAGHILRVQAGEHHERVVVGFRFEPSEVAKLQHYISARQVQIARELHELAERG